VNCTLRGIVEPSAGGKLHARIVHGDDLVPCKIAGLVDSRMFGEIGWRGNDDPPDLADPHGHHR
jgi:hypothetical protein